MNRHEGPGTQYLDINFGRRWNGTPSKSTQALDWSRVGANDYGGELFQSDAVPQPLLDATAEMSIRSAKQDLFDLEPDQAQAGAISEERVKVGSLEVETHYSSGATQSLPWTHPQPCHTSHACSCEEPKRDPSPVESPWRLPA